jgi:hypothetical protein
MLYKDCGLGPLKETDMNTEKLQRRIPLDGEDREIFMKPETHPGKQVLLPGSRVSSGPLSYIHCALIDKTQTPEDMKEAQGHLSYDRRPEVIQHSIDKCLQLSQQMHDIGVVFSAMGA